MDLKASAKKLARRLEFLEHIVKSGSSYTLLSHKGKSLGTYADKAAAEKRERQVEYFKHKEAMKEDDEENLDEEPGEDKERSKIIKHEMKKGHPQKQAIAIAYSKTGEKR